MTPAEHSQYWVVEFSRRLYKLPRYSDEWWLSLKLRADAVKQWRKYHTLRVL